MQWWLPGEEYGGIALFEDVVFLRCLLTGSCCWMWLYIFVRVRVLYWYYHFSLFCVIVSCLLREWSLFVTGSLKLCMEQVEPPCCGATMVLYLLFSGWQNQSCVQCSTISAVFCLVWLEVLAVLLCHGFVAIYQSNLQCLTIRHFLGDDSHPLMTV